MGVTEAKHLIDQIIKGNAPYSTKPQPNKKSSSSLEKGNSKNTIVVVIVVAILLLLAFLFL